MPRLHPFLLPGCPAPWLPRTLPFFLQAGTYSALGYTYHLKGDLDKAIEHYHKVCSGTPCLSTLLTWYA